MQESEREREKSKVKRFEATGWIFLHSYSSLQSVYSRFDHATEINLLVNQFFISLERT